MKAENVQKEKYLFKSCSWEKPNTAWCSLSCASCVLSGRLLVVSLGGGSGRGTHATWDPRRPMYEELSLHPPPGRRIPLGGPPQPLGSQDTLRSGEVGADLAWEQGTEAQIMVYGSFALSNPKSLFLCTVISI